MLKYQNEMINFSLRLLPRHNKMAFRNVLEIASKKAEQ